MEPLGRLFAKKLLNSQSVPPTFCSKKFDSSTDIISITYA